MQFSVCCCAALGKNSVCIAESECYSATSAAQLSENCSAASVLACGVLQGWGLEGWGSGLKVRRAKNATKNPKITDFLL